MKGYCIKLLVPILLILAISFLLVPVLHTASPYCEKSTSIPQDRKKEAAFFNAEWLDNSITCDFGHFQVLAPLDGESESIMMFKNNKLFLIHQNGFGINLMQDYGSGSSVPYVTVQDIDKDGIYEQLDYSLIGEDGSVIGNARDKAMSGSVEVVRFKKDNP